MTINEYLEALCSCEVITSYRHTSYFLQARRPAVVCADGFSVSIQASEDHYCFPRVTQYFDGDSWVCVNEWARNAPPITKSNSFTPYNEVELGFPNLKDDLILEYAEVEDDPTGTVYGNVPVEIVDKLLEKHGGIDIQKTNAAWLKRWKDEDSYWIKDMRERLEKFVKEESNNA